MNDSAALRERIAGLFVERLHMEVPDASTDLFETGALDSMAFVELLSILETEFGITVGLDDLEMDRFRSIASIAAFVSGRNGGPSLGG